MELLVASWCFPPQKKSHGFFRMWSDDGNGFPLPKGCYFGPAQGVQVFFKKINVPKNRRGGGGRRLVMKSFGVLLIRQKQKRWGYLGKRVNPPVVFLRERNDGVGKSSGS